MVRLLCAVAAVALIAPSAATAQYNRHDNNQHDRRDNDRHDRHHNRNHHSSRNYGTYRIGHRPATYRRMNVNAYRYPSGYSYRHWHVGSILPSLFLSSAYYFNGYGSLGLGAPPRGYVWVRYGPDLLLVNRYNGRIVDVIRGAFY